EVFQLPCSGFAEKDGTFTNSARWMQWKWKAIDPPGQAKTDQEVLGRILLAVRALYQKEGGANPEPVLNLDWSYTNPYAPDLAEALKEINGKAVEDIKDPKDPTKIVKKKGDQLDGFAQYMDDGSTMGGNWLHAGVYTSAGNLAQRRNNADPLGLGMFHEWGFSWPANRRIMYNRASADANGKPWDPTRPGIVWNGEKWVGDVPDIKPDSPPGQVGAFIEIPEELAKEKGITNGSRARVVSARGAIEGVAMVTRRMPHVMVDGKPVWHIGFPLHWGYSGDQNHVGPLANFLTPSAMDPNTWTPEYKTFLVKLEKVEGVA